MKIHQVVVFREVWVQAQGLATWRTYQTKNMNRLPAGQESWLKARGTEPEMLGQMKVIILLCLTKVAVLGFFVCLFVLFCFFSRIFGLSLWKTHNIEDNGCHVSLPLSTEN